MKNAITGDRPTGPLHLGHYVGSLQSRLNMQSTHQLTVLVADVQALTDNAGQPQKIAQHIPEVMKDYLAVGLDPKRVNFVLQSAVPQLHELSMLLMNLVSVAQLQRNPTIKTEIQARGFEQHLPAGFFCYPVSQAADIIGLGGGVVPVGHDQLPMIELTNMIIDRLNARGMNLEHCQAFLSHQSRLPGIYGGTKMSKSQGNAINLKGTSEELKKAVFEMYTDPQHIRVSDPGQVEGNVVFSYLDAFDPDHETVAGLKTHYQQGGLGDMLLKRRLLGVMEEHLGGIRERREQLDNNTVIDVLREGTQRIQAQTTQRIEQIKDFLGVFRL